jgi:hypothetical protein
VDNLQDLLDRLAAPFDRTEIKWRAGATTGNRAMALAYVDARVVQDRLDEVVGVAGWKDDYTVQADGSVVCRLSLKLGEDWITKVDVGGASEQPDQGDRLKAAFSDALKRAAIKFGIGRFLYRFPAQWCDWDPQHHRFAKEPALPQFVLQAYGQAHARLRDQTLAILDKIAEQGWDALERTWETLSHEAKRAVEGKTEPAKAKAMAADAAKKGNGRRKAEAGGAA